MRLSLVVVALLLLCGCAMVGDAMPTVRPTAPPILPPTALPIATAQPTPTIAPTVPPTIAPTAPPPPTRTPVAFSDCVWLGLAEVGLDTNGKGVREGAEAPLPGVTIVASDGRVMLSGATDADGRVELRTGLRGCSERGLSVTVTGPSGYRLTTAATLPSQRWPMPYRFGLVPVSPGGGATTPTVSP